VLDVVDVKRNKPQVFWQQVAGVFHDEHAAHDRADMLDDLLAAHANPVIGAVIVPAS
jgi:hypothetical protein